MKIECSISLGELVDKITILNIKKKMISDQSKLELVENERTILASKLDSLKLEGLRDLMDSLQEINMTLWKIEDDIRIKEQTKDFGDEFIELARAVYKTNDQRFDIKNKINNKYGSSVKEVKSYEDY